VCPVRYELGFHNPEEGIHHSHRRENLKCYITLAGWTLQRRLNVSPVRYELGFYILKKESFCSHQREIFTSYIALIGWAL
jgi:hypothetical protein